MLLNRLFLFAACLLASLLGRFTAPVAAQVIRDTLVICPVEFQPALRKWVDYRAQQGHSILVVPPASTSAGIKAQIRRAALANQLRFVFLVGDSGEEHAVASRIVPTDYIAAKVNVLFGSDPEIATDNTFVDLDEDGVPDRKSVV